MSRMRAGKCLIFAGHGPILSLSVTEMDNQTHRKKETFS